MGSVAEDKSKWQFLERAQDLPPYDLLSIGTPDDTDEYIPEGKPMADEPNPLSASAQVVKALPVSGEAPEKK